MTPDKVLTPEEIQKLEDWLNNSDFMPNKIRVVEVSTAESWQGTPIIHEESTDRSIRETGTGT